MVELSALQDQRLQFPELVTCQTGYFGDVCLQCPFGIHMSAAQQNTCTHCLAGITGDVSYFLPGMFKGYEMVECSSFQPGYVRCSLHAQRLQDF